MIKRMCGRKPALIAHRGGAGLRPENTLVAFKNACALEVDGIEMDVLLTADKEVVVHHDFYLNGAIARTSRGAWLSGTGPAIRDLLLKELKEFDVGRLNPFIDYAKLYPEQKGVDGERVPTLEEALDLIQRQERRKTTFWIEMKNPQKNLYRDNWGAALAEKVIKKIEVAGVSKRTFFLSFDWDILAHVGNLVPGIPRVYLSCPARPPVDRCLESSEVVQCHKSVPHMVKAAGGTIWGPPYNALTHGLLQEAHELGLYVSVWTPDNKESISNLAASGVDAITTNRPDLF